MSGTMEFAGKVALVTGGASGIGAAIARRLAAAGAAVVIADLDGDGTRRVAADLPQSLGIVLDVADPAAVAAAVDAAVAKFGALHLAVNNAGIGGASAPTGEYEVAEWRRVLAINLDAVFYGLRFEIPAILAAGGGAVVNMASILGSVGFANAPAYTAAKHGVVGLTRNAALEYSARGVRINAVGPAFIDTPLIQGVPGLDLEALARLHPIGRLGRAEEVAELTAFLLSDRASFITGSYYPIDGGYLAQ
jgi:NAD(P)-dependent dehydrogenase (short-subunit alcohol dehydrogenase family)